MHYEYDLFLSYKTERSNEIRTVAEILMAQGLKVWFAEYMLGSEVYCDDEAEEKRRLRAALESGILQSRYALLFTSDPYARSSWCRRELVLLFKSARDGKRTWESLAEVQFPPGEILCRKRVLAGYFSRLRRTTLHSIERSSVPEIFEFLNDLKWFDPINRDSVEMALRAPDSRSCRMRYGFSLSLPEFAREETEFLFRPTEHSRYFQGEYYQFQAKIAKLRVRLVCTINPFQTTLGELSLAADTPTDDRLLRRRYIGHAREMLVSQNVEEVGHHLVFVQQHSQFSVTWRHSDAGDSDRLWERHYALVIRQTMRCPQCRQRNMRLLRRNRNEARLECPQCRGVFNAPASVLSPCGEIHLSFAVSVPSGELVDERHLFVEVSPRLDAIARSLRCEHAYAWETIRCAAAGLIVGYLTSTVAEYCQLRYGPGWGSALWAAAAGLVAVQGMGPLLVPAHLHRILRAGYRRGRKFPWRLVPFPTYGRMLDNWHAVGVGIVASALFAAFAVLPLAALIFWMTAEWFPLGTNLWLSGALGAALGLGLLILNPQRS